MDDLIYLIALIAWVVFAFYRKSLKKSETAREAQGRPRPQGESEPLPTLEDIFLDEEPSPVVEPVPAYKHFTTDGIPPVLNETAFEKEYNLRGITSIEEMDKPFEISKAKYADIQEHDVLLDKETIEDWRVRVNLRQAVIYSEILNRPYV